MTKHILLTRTNRLMNRKIRSHRPKLQASGTATMKCHTTAMFRKHTCTEKNWRETPDRYMNFNSY